MAYLAIAAPVLVGTASIVLSVCLALPAALPGRPVTLLLLPQRQTSVLTTLTEADPEARLLGVAAGGWLMTVQYARADLPARLRRTGVVAAFGVGLVGCHGRSPSSHEAL